MGKEIVVDINPYQTRVLMDNGSPSEIYIEQRGKSGCAETYIRTGVQNVLPGMQAAFGTSDLNTNAFLYALGMYCRTATSVRRSPELHQEVPNIKDIVKPGQEILVQVLKRRRTCRHKKG